MTERTRPAVKDGDTYCQHGRFLGLCEKCRTHEPAPQAVVEPRIVAECHNPSCGFGWKGHKARLTAEQVAYHQQRGHDVRPADARKVSND